MRIKPREEQRNVTQQVFNTLQQAQSVLVVGPTGVGKTVIMGDIAEEEIARGGRVLAIVNLQVLLGQTVATFQHGFDIPTAALHDDIQTYMLGKNSYDLVCDYDRNVLVTMPKTLNNTIAGSNKLFFDDSFVPTMILFDEAHKATSAEFQAIRNRWPNAKIVGFTATPHREKNDPGESLQEWYGDRMIIAGTMSDFIARGRLARPIYKVIDDPHIAMTWLMVTAGHDNRRTIVFTDDTDHSIKLEKQFKESGIPCEVVTAGKGKAGDDDYVPTQTPKVREAIFKRFHTGKTQVLISVNALCEGFDEKLAKFCFLTRKVANIAFYQQMCGRVLRYCEGKPYGYIIDCAGNLKEHGRVEAIEWPRAAKGLMLKQEEREMCAKSFAKRENVHKECDECGHVYNIKRHAKCTNCDREHGVELLMSVSDYVSEYLGLSAKDFEGMAPKIRSAMVQTEFQAMVNRQLKMEIFQNGSLIASLSYLPKAIEAYDAGKRRVGNKYVGNWEGVMRIAA